jgi:[glutamine synthetase] adenylyltransferase / [glutamine synthetase]-adenylyl-L-tyrosine phosphorylase
MDTEPFNSAEFVGRFDDLLQQIAAPQDLALRWQQAASGQWQLLVSTTDKDGLLTVIAGLLTAHGADICSGDLLTLPAEAGSRQRKTLDLFRVDLAEDEAQEVMQRYTEELQSCNAQLVEGGIEAVRDLVIERTALRFAARSAAQEQLLPVEIVIDNESSETDTILQITSQDTPGFLFAFANALSLLAIKIEQATVRTEEGMVQDVFVIRDLRGRKITDQDKLRELRFACALIKQFAYLLPHSPNPGQAIRQFRDLASRMLENPEQAADLSSIQSASTLQILAEVMGVSRFLWEDFLRMQHENLFPLIRDRAEIDRSFGKNELAVLLQQQLAAAEELEQQVQILNDFKDREMFRIDLRHITGLCGDVEFARGLTDLADVVVAAAAELSHAQLAPRFGKPQLAGQPCPWAILSAGKFGGREMGFASDLELLFVYRGSGQSSGRRSVANSAYFEEFVRTVLKTLKARKEGIFEIDLRLRPFGSKGTLASALPALQDYYAADGKAEPFERMAMIKLRPVAGDKTLCAEVLEVRDAFVYSERLFNYPNLIHLRQRMATELVDSGTVNLKYSPGALVDIEFFLQAQQIKHGVADPELRVPNSMQALKRLQHAGLVEAGQADRIRRAYRCFRRTIDALRAVRGNAKDLTLPDPSSADYRYLARRLGFADPEALSQEIAWSRELSRGLLTLQDQ